jgi:hypothetical protein
MIQKIIYKVEKKETVTGIRICRTEEVKSKLICMPYYLFCCVNVNIGSFAVSCM